jgi:hypothetical protein
MNMSEIDNYIVEYDAPEREIEYQEGSPNFAANWNYDSPPAVRMLELMSRLSMEESGLHGV